MCGLLYVNICVEFASVASCDTAVAQCYLVENDWEMERALNLYFKPPVEEGTLESCPETPARSKSCVNLTNEETTDSISSKTSTSEDIEHLILSNIVKYLIKY